MARLHFVKKNSAGKAVKCETCGKKINVGEKYYHWSNRIGRSSQKHIRCAAHRPRPSSMTTSEHKQVAYSAQEAIEDAATAARGDQDIEALKSTLEDQASELESHMDELDSRISNMEDSFPNGCPSLEILNEYKENFEAMKDSVEEAVGNIDSEWDPTDKEVDVEWTHDVAGEAKLEKFTLTISDLTDSFDEDQAREHAFDFTDSIAEDQWESLTEAINAAREEALQQMVDTCAEAAEAVECNI